MLDGRKITATLTQETIEGLWSSALCRGAEPCCRETHKGTQEWLLLTEVYGILISKNSQISFPASSGGFECATTVVC